MLGNGGLRSAACLASELDKTAAPSQGGARSCSGYTAAETCEQADAGSACAAGLACLAIPASQPSLSNLAAAWPELAALRPAASSPNLWRLRSAVTTFISHTRVEFASALVDARKSCGLVTCALTAPAQMEGDSAGLPALEHGRLRHRAALDLLRASSELVSTWHLSPAQALGVISQLQSIVSSVDGIMPCPPPKSPRGSGRPARFPHSISCFLAALAGGWPWDLAVSAFSRLGDGLFFKGSRIFWVASALDVPGPKSWCVSNLTLAGKAAELQIITVNGLVALIRSSVPLQPTFYSSAEGSRLSVNCKRSNFLPDYIRVLTDPATGRLMPPAARVTVIVERAAIWKTRLGPLDGTAQAIVDGNFTYPRRSWAFAPSWKRNHRSWEQCDKAKFALGPTIAHWLLAGILELVPHGCPPPLVIEPVGAVEKGTDPYYRLITDARLSNEELDEWPVRYWTVLEAAAGLSYGALMCADDAKDAYHLSAFAGCTGALIEDESFCLEQDGSWAKKKRYFLGCSPSTCLGTCDKARSGICLDGFLFRFAAAQFGQKLAGSPLNALFFPIIRHLVNRFRGNSPLLGLLCSLWVDDLFLAQNVNPHGSCGGLLAGCAICVAAKLAFAKTQSYWHQLACDLGITLSPSKRQEISQQVEYTGIVLDSIQGRFYIPDKKKVKLLSCLGTFVGLREFSLRALASLRGRVLHYSICIMYIRPLVSLLVVPGADLDDLDSLHPMSSSLLKAGQTLLDLVERFAPLGSPMWPYVPSSLYGRFLRGELAGMRLVVIIWDSSVHGWGAIIRWWDNFEGELVVGTFGPDDDVSAQVHREARGGCLALEAAATTLDLHGAVVIFRNDAVGALAALRKGSSAPALQESAARLNLLCAELRVEPYFLHAPGKALVDEGVDDASRSLAEGVSGAACSPKLRAEVHAIASRLGWRITVDAFASLCNRVVDRFFSEYAEPDAEAVDALSVTDWDRSVCPSCGSTHRETIFAFPPRALLRRFMSKAEEDEIRGIVIVPLSITAFYWRRLLDVALPLNGNNTPFVSVRNLKDALVEPRQFRGSSLAIFAVDFSLRGRRRSNGLSPPCGQEATHRARPPLGQPQDVEDRWRIHLSSRSRTN